MGAANGVESLLILGVFAFLIPLVVHQIRLVNIPVTVAEILVGMVIGKSGLNIIHEDPWLEFLALLGLVFLMFLSGMEVDLPLLFQRRRAQKGQNVLITGLILFGSTFLLSLLFALILSRQGLSTSPWFLTLIFSTTSLGVVVPTLRETGIMERPIGQTILIAALIADFMTMILVPLVMFFQAGTGEIKGIFLLILMGFLAVIYWTGKHKLVAKFDNSVAESSQWLVRTAIAVILILVWLTETAGVEMILGAFLAGICYSVLIGRARSELQPKLEAIGYGFLIPIFFIVVGIKFDLQPLLKVETLAILPLFLYLVYVVKVIPALFLSYWYSLREALGTGVLLSARLSLIIAIASLAWQEGVIQTSSYYTLILLSMVTCLLSPLIFIRILRGNHIREK